VPTVAKPKDASSSQMLFTHSPNKQYCARHWGFRHGYKLLPLKSRDKRQAIVKTQPKKKTNTKTPEVTEF
jgi:hypothetical protein